MPRRTNAFTRPRGTRDFLPEEMARRRQVEATMRGVFEDFGYGEIRTPIFEHLELITAKSGEEITRHLYHFKDKSGRDITLRPELTAPAMRLYLQELTHSPKPVKLYYFGDCFRYERPQSGRYREFRQAGVELIGSPHPEAEAEVITLAVSALKELGLEGFSVSIGEVGVLRALLGAAGIRGDEQARVMAVIDKGEDVKEVLEGLGMPGDLENLLIRIIELKGSKESLRKADALMEKVRAELKEARSRFRRLEDTLRFLEAMNVEYTLDLGIARGLDYYTGMVFEVYAEELGAQKQICGGGTYTLTDVLGGKPAPTCGFAFGFDRIILALESQEKLPKSTMARLLVVPTDVGVMGDAMRIASVIRRKGGCEVELMRRKLHRALAHANNIGCQRVIIVGEEELARGCVVLRDMIKGEQREVRIEDLEALL
ncbi:MAG: histidine--tRNA ligase [Candidatus Hydrothermarchaeaceae archaeon]